MWLWLGPHLMAVPYIMYSDVKTEFFSQPIIGLPKPVLYR